jgi:cyclophilin family peptidyl-prolyl cis-trans isomerase
MLKQTFHIMRTKQLLIIAVIAAAFAACGAGPKKQNDMEKRTQVKIETTVGDIVVELYNETPKHRDNFIKLAKQGTYDNTLFHRVIKQFMIQAGDPDSKNANDSASLGSGDVGYTIPAEILPQFIHKKGALAAARMGDEVNPKKESSGCQFYIVTGRTFREAQLLDMAAQKNNARVGQIFDQLAQKHMKEILKEFAESVYDFTDKTITFSCGVAFYKDGITREDLFNIADSRMYYAKKNGKNQVVINNA